MKRVTLGEAAQVRNGALTTFTVAGRSVVVARVDGRYCAVASKCPHLGGDLGKGRLDGDVIICPVHGSRFEMCSGAVVDWAPKMPGVARRLGTIIKKPTAVQAFAVEEDAGKLYLAG